MFRVALLALGGAAGTVARYGLNGVISGHQARSWLRWAAFPAGTLTVNVLGCFAIGVLAALTEAGTGRAWIRPEWRDFLMIGFCGGFTTFSSYGLQTLSLVRGGDWLAGFVNVAGSNVCGLVAVWLGWAAGRAFQARVAGGLP